MSKFRMGMVAFKDNLINKTVWNRSAYFVKMKNTAALACLEFIVLFQIEWHGWGMSGLEMS